MSRRRRQLRELGVAKRFTLLALAWGLAGLAAAEARPAPAPASPAAVVAAERAFAADVLAVGARQSFLKHSAPGAVMLAGGFVDARKTLTAWPEPGPGSPGPQIVWWPAWAGIACSGDLGFSTGPAEINASRKGYYLTVWRKQPDGVWKWVYDGPAPGAPWVGAARTAQPEYLAPSACGSGSRAAAVDEVAAIEHGLAQRSSTHARTALLSHLAPDARVHSAGAPPGHGEHASAALAGRPQAVSYEVSSLDASGAGDLVWTLGRARSSVDGAERAGHFVRVWQRRPEGWRLVFDQLDLAPRAAAASK